MGKTSKRRYGSKGGGKGWRSTNADGKMLKRLLLKGTITAAMPPGAVKEQWSEFRKYNNEAFSAGLRRMKHKLGILVREKPEGKSWSRSVVSRSRHDPSCHSLF